jgi:glycosyltransferase involved in cell wall biosynthesis
MSDRRPIRVCVLNPDFYRSSGVTIAIRRIFEAMPPEKVEFWFVAASCVTLEEDLSWIPEARFRRFDLMTGHPDRLVSETRTLLRYLRNAGVDVIHSHHRRLAIYARLLSGFIGAAPLYTAQLSYPFSLPFWLGAPRWCCSTSPSISANVRATTPVSHIIETGNPACFPIEPAPIEKTSWRTAVCVARLEPVKGHIHLLKAWAKMSQKDCRLVLVGEGSLRANLESLAAELGISDRILFAGYVAAPEIFVRESLFAILASEVEGLPLAAIEASGQGRAVLVTDVPGNRDLVPPHVTLPNRVPYGDVDALAQALDFWFSRPSAVAEEGILFRNFLKEKYDAPVVAEAYAKVYQSLVSRA